MGALVSAVSVCGGTPVGPAAPDDDIEPTQRIELLLPARSYFAIVIEHQLGCLTP